MNGGSVFIFILFKTRIRNTPLVASKSSEFKTITIAQ
jgi:hypothetical protein